MDLLLYKNIAALYFCIADIQNHNCFKSSFSVKLKDVSIVDLKKLQFKHTTIYTGLYYKKLRSF